ncbi:retrotransposon protein, putative, ty1-copia subclass [Tanacetum coccineum]
MFVIEQPIPPAPVADSMLHELKSMFEKQAGVERFDLIQTFHACKQEEGKPVAAYVLQMKGYVDQLERLGYVLPQDLSVGLILSLPKKAETPQVMMIKSGKIQKANKKSLKAKGKGKANGKGKDKQVYIPKPKNPKPSAKEHPAKDDTCHYCKEVGHWKRNCHVYLAELLKKKKQVGTASSSEARKLKQGALYLYMGNGVRAQVEAIASYDLVLPNGLVICLDNFSKNNVHYFNVIPSNGIYEIDMHDLVPNVNSIYNVSTKRAKHNLDSTYLWHCRLAHISKKRIEKLQQEGLLKSTDDESFDQCVSCLSGKMTRKSFPHRPERATDLLGIIHTDVFKNEVENQPGKTIKALQSDRGGEYISQEFKDYLKSYGITQQLTPPYTPQHNGMSEKSATCIRNMVPTKKVDKTPYELWYGKVPNLSYLKDTRVQMGYLFLLPPEYKYCLLRYAAFFEKNLITQEVSGRTIFLEEIQDEDTSPSEITSESPMEVEGFEPPQKEVIPIRRSVYGLKEASRSWNKRFDEEIKKFGFDQNLDEPCVYQKAGGSNVKFLILYVDDIIIGNHIPSLQSVKDYIGKCFAMKDWGKQHLFLESKSTEIGASTPKEVKRMQNVSYASVVGSIMYAFRCIRPDVAFAQNITSRFQQNPDELHRTAVKNILKYLRNTKDMFLVSGGNPKDELRVDCYCDAGFETDRDDTKSQTGYVFILNGGAVDWKSSKQSTTAMSAT